MNKQHSWSCRSNWGFVSVPSYMSNSWR